MRTDTATLDRIVAWGERSEVIRAVVLSGSRADPSRAPDNHSDYDIAIFVTTLAPFLADDQWVTQFGTPLARWPLSPRNTGTPDETTQLVQYASGLRIDFQLYDRAPLPDDFHQEPHRFIVDKEGFTAADIPGDGYRIRKPGAEEFAEQINAFWWDIIYVPKALCRGELPFAHFMLDSVIRTDQLEPLLSWQIGIERSFDTNVGPHGRWFATLLEPELWDRYTRTYCDAEPVHVWEAVSAAIALVAELAPKVAAAFGLEYDEATARGVSRYVEKLRRECGR